jgi:hypothetical protein
VQPGDPVRHIPLGADDDDRQIGGLGHVAEAPAHLQPADLRHNHVQDDQMGAFELGKAQRFGAVRCSNDVISGALEHEAQQA